MIYYDFQIVKDQEFEDERLQIEMLNKMIISVIEEFGFTFVGGSLGIKEVEENDEEE